MVCIVKDKKIIKHKTHFRMLFNFNCLLLQSLLRKLVVSIFIKHIIGNYSLAILHLQIIKLSKKIQTAKTK